MKTTPSRRLTIKWAGTLPPRDWASCRVKELFLDDAPTITVNQLDDLEVDHYSIPAFDETGKPAREHGSTIASNKTLLRGGELLFSKLNSHKPRVWLVPVDDHIKVASTEFIALREWHSRTVSKSFFAYVLGSASFADYITCFQTSVTNSHRRINPEDLLSTEVPHPSLQEQHLIATYLDESCAAIDAVASIGSRPNDSIAPTGVLDLQMLTLAAYRKSLIHECVTGHRRITEADINLVKALGS
jgi:type I restriction enzyme S subunit